MKQVLYIFIIFFITSCQFEVPEALKTNGCTNGNITYTVDVSDTQRYTFSISNASGVKYPITWQNNAGATIGTTNSSTFTYKFPSDGNYFVRAIYQNNCGDNFSINSNAFSVTSIFKINLVTIAGGTFQMGSVEDNIVRQQPVHNVTLNSFKMGTHEITQSQYLKIMGTNPSKNVCLSCPVTNVSWLQANIFCNKLSELENKTQVYTNINKKDGVNDYVETTINFSANGYRLPTEAEWEYAAGGGAASRTRFGNSTNIAKTSEINFNGIAANKIVQSETGINRASLVNIGSFSPNRLGLYDMAGNVSEWCNDWYKEDYYKTSPSSNPTGPVFINNSNQWRVIRGGSYATSPNLLKVFNRNFNNYWGNFDDIGFRVVTNP